MMPEHEIKSKSQKKAEQQYAIKFLCFAQRIFSLFSPLVADKKFLLEKKIRFNKQDQIFQSLLVVSTRFEQFWSQITALSLALYLYQCLKISKHYNNNSNQFMNNHQILLILAFTFLVSSQMTDPAYNYDTFIMQFGRDFAGQQKIDHQRAFNSTYSEIIKRKALGQPLDVNNFTDWTQDQLNQYFNYHPEKYGRSLSSSANLRSQALFAPPPSFDWKALNRVTPVKNQGSCGSCWAFSSTAQYESALAIKLNGTFYDLAEQYGVQCEKNVSSGCNGGFPTQANILFNQTGIPLQSLFPYKGTSGTYNQTAICNTSAKIKLLANVTNIYHLRTATVQQLEDIIYNYGPTGIGVYASDLGFRSVNSAGAITCRPVSSINHAILLYGYNSTHWFIKNSWGTGWGHQGYAYISKSGDCGITKWVDVMEIIYNYVPPPPPPVNTSITLIINMTDFSNNGWQGNRFSLRQNGVNVVQFGQNFTTGSTFNATVSINSKLMTQIALTTLGNATNQIGFVIKYLNGTIIFNRTRGTFLRNLQILQTFCPVPTCLPASFTMSILMTDSFGDGWEGTILGFKQNNYFVQKFGNGFTSGRIRGPFNFTIPGQAMTDITVFQLGNYTREIGFIILAPNQTVIHNRTSGSSFNLTAIFRTFCPLGNCVTIPPFIIYITLTSSCSGWGKNVLGVRQGGIIIANLSLANGIVSQNPISVSLQQFSLVEFVVVTYGDKSWQVGFNVRTQIGSSLGERIPGNSYSADSILFSFTPGVTNTGPVFEVDDVTQQGPKYQGSVQIRGQKITERQKKLIIASIFFISSTIILGIGFMVLLIKRLKEVKKKKSDQQYELESANTINKQVGQTK